MVCWFPNRDAFRVHPQIYLDGDIRTRRRQQVVVETGHARDYLLASRGRSRLDFACASMSWGGHVRKLATSLAFVMEGREGSRPRSGVIPLCPEK